MLQIFTNNNQYICSNGVYYSDAYSLNKAVSKYFNSKVNQHNRVVQGCKVLYKKDACLIYTNSKITTELPLLCTLSPFASTYKLVHTLHPELFI